MSDHKLKIQHVEQIMKRFDLPCDNSGFEERMSLLFQACDYVENEMDDFAGDLHYVKTLLAYTLANKVYQYVFDTMIKLDGMNSTIKVGFFRAYQIAKIGYDYRDKRLQKFIDELLYISKQSGDQVMVDQLNKESSYLSDSL